VKQNFWTWWVYKPTEEEMKYINELYIDIDSKWHQPKTDEELIDYIDICKICSVEPYIIVNCFASANNIGLTFKEVVQKAKDKIDYVVDIIKAHPVLDYIRSSKDIKVPTKYIYEVIDYSLEKDSEAKSSIMSLWKAWYFNQNYTEFYKRITICPMVYGTGLFTKLSLIIHKLLYPKCYPCIRAWGITNKEFCTQISIIKDHKYTIWKWNDWKKLQE